MRNPTRTTTRNKCAYCESPARRSVTREQRDAWDRLIVRVCGTCYRDMNANGLLA